MTIARGLVQVERTGQTSFHYLHCNIQPIGGKRADPQLRHITRAIETETGSSTGAIPVVVARVIPIGAACGLVHVERTY